MSFAHPWVLIVGMLVTATIAGALALALRRSARAAVVYSDLPFLIAATGAHRDPARAIAAACVVAVACAALAVAGPHAVLPVAVHGTVVICVDTSGSMRATDVVPSRAAAAASAVRAFIDAMPDGTDAGIVAFAGSAGVIAPVTGDKDALVDAIARLPAPNGGTAIGDALAAAADLLPSTGRRAIVLITDGVNNSGADPLSVAARIGLDGIEIDTIGIGTDDPDAIIPGTSETATIDEDALRAIATDGRGTYARVDDAGALRDRLAALARTTTHEQRRVDLSLPFALVAVGILTAAVAGGMLAGRFP
jgi:Ca-activated chloride channel family protein